MDESVVVFVADIGTQAMVRSVIAAASDPDLQRVIVVVGEPEPYERPMDRIMRESEIMLREVRTKHYAHVDIRERRTKDWEQRRWKRSR